MCYDTAAYKVKVVICFLVKMNHFFQEYRKEMRFFRVIMDVTVKCMEGFQQAGKRLDFRCCGSFKSDHRKMSSASYQVRRKKIRYRVISPNQTINQNRKEL